MVEIAENGVLGAAPFAHQVRVLAQGAERLPAPQPLLGLQELPDPLGAAQVLGHVVVEDAYSRLGAHP